MKTKNELYYCDCCCKEVYPKYRVCRIKIGDHAKAYKNVKIKICPECGNILTSIDRVDAVKISTMENYKNLSRAIINTAKTDYINSLKRLMNDPCDQKGLTELLDVFTFFESDMYHEIAIDGMEWDRMKRDPRYIYWQKKYVHTIISKIRDILNKTYTLLIGDDQNIAKIKDVVDVCFDDILFKVEDIKTQYGAVLWPKKEFLKYNLEDCDEEEEEINLNCPDCGEEGSSNNQIYSDYGPNARYCEKCKKVYYINKNGGKQ